MKNIHLLLILSVFLVSCSNVEYRVSVGETQGTTFRIIYQSEENYNKVINDLLIKFDNVLSNYNDSSMISKINRNEDVELNDIFIEFYNKSKYAYEKSNGYFDVTVGPIVEAWGFSKKQKFNCDSASIDSLLNFVGMNKIRIENKKLIKDDPNVLINSNAIAQGQSVDFIADFFKEKGIENYLIEIGGEVRAQGVNPQSKTWLIGIDKPIENLQNRELQGVISLENRSLATSGNYRKFVIYEGKKYSHSINPKTGYPAKDKILSATIIADECSIADAYATACMVMGFDLAKDFVEKNKDIEAYLIYAGENNSLQIYTTEGIKKYLSN